MMRILLTGAGGQLGWELRRSLAPFGDLVAADRHRVDLADRDGVRRAVRELAPRVIVNAGAHTAVDRAESEPDLAMAVNGVGPGILAEEARRLGAAIVHFSTDYVFDGAKRDAYVEEDATAPLSVYGRTKLAGEEAIRATGASHLILRTSWVYGVRGVNFLRTVCRLAAERPELRMVDDQTGAPTWTRMIAEATAQVIAAETARRGHPLFAETGGVYHLTARGSTTWCGFARAILARGAAFGVSGAPRLVPIRSAEYPTAARRPLNSVLSNAKLERVFGLALPAWDESLRLCAEEAQR